MPGCGVIVVSERVIAVAVGVGDSVGVTSGVGRLGRGVAVLVGSPIGVAVPVGATNKVPVSVGSRITLGDVVLPAVGIATPGVGEALGAGEATMDGLTTGATSPVAESTWNSRRTEPFPPAKSLAKKM